MQIFVNRRLHRFGLNHAGNHAGAKALEEPYHQEGGQKHKTEGVVEKTAHTARQPFAHAVGNKNLGADAEAQHEHHRHLIEDGRQCPGRQLGFAHMTKEHGVGQGNDVLRQLSQDNRKGYAKDVSVRHHLLGIEFWSRVRHFDGFCSRLCLFAWAV